MERTEIKGTLAISGKEWACCTDSTKKEIKKLNHELSDEEIDTIYNLIHYRDEIETPAK